MQRGRTQGHEGRQILIFTAQAITHPRPHAGPQKGLAAGVQFHAGTSMSHVGFAQ